MLKADTYAHTYIHDTLSFEYSYTTPPPPPYLQTLRSPHAGRTRLRTTNALPAGLTSTVSADWVAACSAVAVTSLLTLQAVKSLGTRLLTVDATVACSAHARTRHVVARCAILTEARPLAAGTVRAVSAFWRVGDDRYSTCSDNSGVGVIGEG